MTDQLAGDLEPRSNPRFLVVEDEALLAMYLEDILLSLNCQVLMAARVSKATALLDLHCVDGAFLDVSIPGTPIYPLVDILLSRSIPFVFVTGHHPDRIPAKYRDCLILSKPLVEPQFRQMAMTFAAQARAKRDRAESQETRVRHASCS